MRKEKEKNISGQNFKVTQLGFEDSIDLLTLLTKTLAPSLGALANGVDGKEVSIQSALTELSQRLSAKDLKQVIYTLAKTTRIEREPGKWPVLEPEVDLAGDMLLTFKWLGFALEVNYGSFLGAAGLVGKVKDLMANPAAQA